MKKVQLKMRSIQTFGQEREESELLTDGLFGEEDGMWKISYDDSDATGFDGSTTTITVDGNRTVNIIRTGTADSNLMIETGKKHFSLYRTPFGEMTMGVFTYKIDTHLKETGGTLYLKYSIDMNSSHVSDNEIYLDISK